MAQAVPSQHPQVVLRSHYQHVRALLAVAMIAVVGLTIAVVILATTDDRVTSIGAATEPSVAAPVGGIRYDGGPEEGTGGVRAAPSKPDSSTSSPGIRYDGGPEEGTSGEHGSSSGSSATPGIRYDGGPEEGTALAR
jgi:hypothetical protein